MISIIEGNIQYLGPDYIILECNNIGYKIIVPKSYFNVLPREGQIRVYTHLLVKENDLTLYGFNNVSERELFERLLTVSGLGAKTALSVLSTYQPEHFYSYILNEDIKALSSIPGVGPKTANRMVFELKDKLKKTEKYTGRFINRNGPREEAVIALETLGWSAAEAIKLIDSITISEDATAEDIIKLALSHLNKA